MIVREIITDAKTGEVTVREIEIAGVLTEQQGQAADVERARLETNARTIEQQAGDAIAGNLAFLAIASPTNAQTLAQVKALTRQNNKIIRLLLRRFDSTD